MKILSKSPQSFNEADQIKQQIKESFTPKDQVDHLHDNFRKKKLKITHVKDGVLRESEDGTWY